MNFTDERSPVNELIDNCMADRMSRRQLDALIECKSSVPPLKPLTIVTYYIPR